MSHSLEDNTVRMDTFDNNGILFSSCFECDGLPMPPSAMVSCPGGCVVVCGGCHDAEPISVLLQFCYCRRNKIDGGRMTKFKTEFAEREEKLQMEFTERAMEEAFLSEDQNIFHE